MPIKIAHILNSNVANAIIGEITIPNAIPIKTIKNRINFVFLLIIVLVVLPLIHNRLLIFPYQIYPL